MTSSERSEESLPLLQGNALSLLSRLPFARTILVDRCLLIRCRMLVALFCLSQAIVFGGQRSGLDPKDCTVGTAEPIIAKSKGVIITRKGPFELVEQFQLSPQIKAEITQAGCAHYGLKMAFTFPAPKSAEGNMRTDAEAIRLLRALKPRMKLVGPIDEAIAILTKYQNKPIEEGQPLQDSEFEMVTLYLKSETNGSKRLLVVTYALAL